MFPMSRRLAILGGRGVRYLLRDDFSDTLAAGAVNGTPATPGPGTRTVVDTNSKITVGSGTLNFATGEATNDGIRYGIQTRSAGKVLVAKLKMTGGIGNLGLDADTSGAITDSIALATGSAINIVVNGGTAFQAGAYAAGTEYTLAAVMRSTGVFWFIKGGAFTYWMFLFPAYAGSANMYPAIVAGNTTSVFTVDNVYIHSSTWLPIPYASDGFGASGITDGLGHIEATGLGAGGSGHSWTGATFTTTGGQVYGGATLDAGELLTNGDAETGDPPTGWTPKDANCTLSQSNTQAHGGTYSAKCVTSAGYSGVTLPTFATVPGKFYRWSCWVYGTGQTYRVAGTNISGSDQFAIVSANTWTQVTRIAQATTTGATMAIWGQNASTFYIDDASCQAVNIASLFYSLSTLTPDVIVDFQIPVLGARGAAGVVLRLDSASNPQNFITVTLASDNSFRCFECVSGTYAQLVTAVGYSPVTTDTYRVVVRGTAFQLYKITNVGVVSQLRTGTTNITTGNLHGIISTDSTNTLDNFVLYPAGSGGEHSRLDFFAGL
jgi:hypothetical protein